MENGSASFFMVNPSKYLMEIQDYDVLTTEELEFLTHILMSMYLREIWFHEGFVNEGQLEERLFRIGEELYNRMRSAIDPYEKAKLFFAADDLSRIDEQVNGYKDFIKSFVCEVMSSPTIAYPILHASLEALLSEPLTRVVLDNNGRRYQFTVGEDFFQKNLQQWASTQNIDGSWTGITAEEAYGRICVIGHDFGSVKGIDNDHITNLAYDYYSQAPCQTPKQLYAQFDAYRSKWGNEYNYKDFIAQAKQMLHSDSLMLADRLRLLYILRQ